MNILSNFINYDSLNNFVQNNFQELSDFLLDKFFIYDEKFKDFLDDFFYDNTKKITENLKQENIKERQIIELLANLAYRYNDSFSFCEFCNVLELDKSILLDNLYKLNRITDINNSYAAFSEALEVFNDFYEKERSNALSINYIMANFIYYKLISRIHNRRAFSEIYAKFASMLSKNYSFLDRDFFDSIFQFDCSNAGEFLDNYLRQINSYLNPNCQINTKAECETGTYADNLKTFGCATFDDILKYAHKYYRDNITDANTRYYNLNRGKAILNCEDDLFQYIHSFGSMHRRKLLAAFNNTKLNLMSYKKCRVIDYACGQGMGTMNLIDFINNNNLEVKIEEIILIEPSQKALARAILHSKKFAKNTKITAICKYLNDLNLKDLARDDMDTIQIFSNILDMNEVRLNTSLYTSIKSSFGNKNLFICVSPYGIANDRLDLFYEYFKDNFDARQISNKSWLDKPTKYEQIFEVRK